MSLGKETAKGALQCLSSRDYAGESLPQPDVTGGRHPDRATALAQSTLHRLGMVRAVTESNTKVTGDSIYVIVIAALSDKVTK
jgi:hypothetical protein